MAAFVLDTRPAILWPFMIQLTEETDRLIGQLYDFCMGAWGPNHSDILPRLGLNPGEYDIFDLVRWWYFDAYDTTPVLRFDL